MHEAGREHSPERRALLQRFDMLRVDLVVLEPLPKLVRHVRRQHALALQGPKPLEDDSNGDYRARDDRHHHPSAGLHDLEHENSAPYT